MLKQPEITTHNAIARRSTRSKGNGGWRMADGGGGRNYIKTELKTKQNETN